MAKNDLFNRSNEELKQLLSDSVALSFRLQIQKTTQQLKNFNQIKAVRRDIARYKTVLAQKGERV